MSHLNLIISTSNNVVSLVLPTSSSIDVTIESQKTITITPTINPDTISIDQGTNG